MTDLLQTPRPFGGFRCILADPPWAFITRSRGARLPQRHTAAAHYPTMTRGELLRLPVRDMAADDCALIMWAVDSHLAQAIELGQDWGFGFKTKVFTWIKTDSEDTEPPMGMGHWTRKQTEQAYLFTRGTPKRLSGGVREIIYAPRREHSRKPDEQYDRIHQLVGGPYLELFNRTAAPGWSAWGNEAGRFQLGDAGAQPVRVAAAASS